MKLVKESLNEIKRNTEGSGLGAIGIGKIAMLFARDLERELPGFKEKSTYDQYVSTYNTYYISLKKKILEILNTPTNKIKVVQNQNIKGNLRVILDDILYEKESTKLEEIKFKYPNHKNVETRGSNGNIIHDEVLDGTFQDVNVYFRYNLDYGVLMVSSFFIFIQEDGSEYESSVSVDNATLYVKL